MTAGWLGPYHGRDDGLGRSTVPVQRLPVSSSSPVPARVAASPLRRYARFLNN